MSQGDKGQLLHFEDATMRAQFNKVGANSSYHLILHPNILAPVTINVPANQGVLRESPQGVIFRRSTTTGGRRRSTTSSSRLTLRTCRST